MNSQIPGLANSFFIVALIMGLPSLAVTILYGCYRFRLWMAPPTGTAASVKNPDAILIVLDGMTRVIGALANFLGFLGKLVFGGLAIVSAFVLIFAIALFFTGRGLQAEQNWARIAGGMLMAGVLMPALLSMVIFRGVLLLLSLTLVAASAYAMWILWQGFGV